MGADQADPPGRLPDRRARVMSAVRSAGRPISVGELASLLALHPNTVRFHAQALEAAGLLSQRQQATGGKGRPRVLYEATPRGLRAGKHSYLLLATMLLEWLIRDSADPVAAAQAAGRELGGRLARSGPRGERRLPSIQTALGVLTDGGFDPVPAPHGVDLLNCPFRELVDTHQKVVCAAHLGVLQGTLAGPPQELTALEQATVVLEPLASPGRCVVRIDPRPSSPAGDQPPRPPG